MMCMCDVCRRSNQTAVYPVYSAFVPAVRWCGEHHAHAPHRYRVGVIDGQEQLRRELAADLHQAGAAWREETGWKPGHPSYAELQRRRGEPADQVRRNHAQPIRRPQPKPTGRTTP